MIERGDTPGISVESATSSTVGAGIFIEEVDERSLSPATIVGNGLSGTLGEELESGISGDAKLLGRSLSGRRICVDLGNDNIGLADKVLGNSLVDGSKRFAVTAPGLEKTMLTAGKVDWERGTNSVKLNQNVLVSVHNLIEVGFGKSNNNTGCLLLHLGLDTGLLRDVSLQGSKIPSRVVIDRRSRFAVKVLEGRETGDTEAFAECLMICLLSVLGGIEDAGCMYHRHRPWQC